MTLRLFLFSEFKKYPFFFLLLIITLGLGTVGLTGISVVSDQVSAQLEKSAKDLLTSDLAVNARRELSEEETVTLDKIMAKFAHERYKIIDVYSMVRHEESFQTRLVEVRAVENGFPFHGEVELEDNTPYDVSGLVISKDLAELWSIKTGDSLKLGELVYPVQGIVGKDTSVGMRGLSLAPRVYLPMSELQKTGLLKPGATGSFAHHFRFTNPQDAEDIKGRILVSIADRAVKVTLPKDSSEQSGRIHSYLTDFMSLAALIGLLLSLVGVFYLYQSHLTSRLKDLCLYNLFGLQKKGIIWGVFIQFTLVFLVVFVLELVLIIPLLKFSLPHLSQSLGIPLSDEINLRSALIKLPFLYALSLAVLVPLLFGLMRTQMGQQLRSPKISMGNFHVVDFIPFGVLLWSLACYLSHSFKTGSIFFGALALICFLSGSLITVLQKILGKMVAGKGLLNPNIETGIAIRNIVRSGHKLTMSFLSLAMGATLISLILQLDRLIQDEFTLDQKRPSLFIFDVQEDQLDPLLDFAKKKGVPLEGITPLIRARMEKLNGKPFVRSEAGSLETREEEAENRFRNRGVNLTYRKNLSHAERLTDGRAFPETFSEDRPGEISLEKRFAQRMGIKIGDKILFDVQGVEVEGLVTSFREVKWTSFYPNFFVNFEPGVVDGAPKTYLAVLPQSGRELKAHFQRDSIERFPNISFIDVGEVIGRLSNLFDRSRQAMELISFLSLAVGLIILYGLSHDQVYRRYYDLALMKTLGLSPRQLYRQILFEFGTIFLLAMSVGFILGWALAMAIGREVFKLSPMIDWTRILVPGALLSILCLVTILLSSRRAVRTRPRELLSDS